MGNTIYINDASKVFDLPEKWEAFNQLIEIKKDIIRIWYENLRKSVAEKIKANSKLDKWKERKWTGVYYSYGWYLGEYDQNSLVILFEDNQFCLWIESNVYNVDKIIADYGNSILFTKYFNEDIRSANEYLVKKSNPIDIFNKNDTESIAWYAGNAHEGNILFIDKVYSLFINFMEDEEVIEIIKDINTNYKLS